MFLSFICRRFLRQGLSQSYTQYYEIPRNSPKIHTYSVQGHPRSSIFMPIESAYATSYYMSLIVTLYVISYCFRDIDAFCEKQLVFPSHPCLTPPSGGTPCDINVICTPRESTFTGLQFCRRHYGISSFVQPLLHLKIAKSREIPKECDLQQFKVIQCHRSWCQSKAHNYVTSCQSLTAHMERAPVQPLRDTGLSLTTFNEYLKTY